VARGETAGDDGKKLPVSDRFGPEIPHDQIGMLKRPQKGADRKRLFPFVGSRALDKDGPVVVLE
jgi:hypothetical protein